MQTQGTRQIKQFDEETPWWRGNLHCHTKESDGAMEFAKCVDMHRQAGYDFLAITDHNNPTVGRAYEDFLLLGGGEWDWLDWEDRKAVHITGVGLQERVERHEDPQDVIAQIQQAGGIAVLAHPAWSLLGPDDILALSQVDAVELWNTVSETHSRRGDSSWLLDKAAAQGWRKPILAVDDTHYYDRDLYGGWIMVQAAKLDRAELLESIKANRFYATQGPAIKQIEVSETHIHVETSPVSEISFMTNIFFSSGRVVIDPDGELRNASYRFSPHDTYVRVECRDKDEKRAWSQYISV